MSENSTPLFELNGLQCLFPMRRGLNDLVRGQHHYVHAVDEVTFSIGRGEILALVGESGCGKSTLGRMLVKLQETTGGQIVFDGEDVTGVRGQELKTFRRRAQIVFQNPFEAFDPRLTVGESLQEAMLIHNIGTKDDREARIVEVLERSGLTPGRNFLTRFPHELSGGQSQRIATVRAMLLSPEFMVADEPVSMLDVSVRADILNQLLDLRESTGMSIVFITHDLSVARYIADRIAVMYLGMFVELGASDQIISDPKHPYSRALLSNTLPVGDEELTGEPLEIGGEVPTPVDLKPGCRFASRCPYVFDRCRNETPLLLAQPDGTQVACHLFS